MYHLLHLMVLLVLHHQLYLFHQQVVVVEANIIMLDKMVALVVELENLVDLLVPVEQEINLQSVLLKEKMVEDHTPAVEEQE